MNWITNFWLGLQGMSCIKVFYSGHRLHDWWLEKKTIWQSNSFGPFEWQTCLVFRSPLYKTTILFFTTLLKFRNLFFYLKPTWSEIPEMDDAGEDGAGERSTTTTLFDDDVAWRFRRGGRLSMISPIWNIQKYMFKLAVYSHHLNTRHLNTGNFWCSLFKG